LHAYIFSYYYLYYIRIIGPYIIERVRRFLKLKFLRLEYPTKNTHTRRTSTCRAGGRFQSTGSIALLSVGVGKRDWEGEMDLSLFEWGHGGTENQQSPRRRWRERRFLYFHYIIYKII
jgi:hypothetical protein